MTTYRHPEYWKFEMWWKHIVVTINDCYGAISTLEIPNHIWLLALWFEEVVEEKKQDWKLDLYESLEWLFGKWLDELEEFLAFRKKLETHMPPQKKFTGNDVHEHSMKTYGSDSGFYVNFTLNFLRDHDLLEE